ncbi:CidA/LrgA family protein [Pseudogracilibacillus sp. ICA-222130]|uniref:CidA/LrgA family protein n=1 Tax=Pseudogracilibacillus sp. ICA-222130 TaxID=3134655 RepID=UPI0030C00915
MKLLKIISQIALLFCFYYIGVFIQQSLGLFIPGSVIGLVLMFLCLIGGIVKVNWISAGASVMVTHLALFFIPATVGILNYYKLFAGKGVLLLVITIISSILVMGISGFVSERLAKKGVESHE